MDVEARLRRGATWSATDDGARWAFRMVLAGSLIVLYLVGALVCVPVGWWLDVLHPGWTMLALPLVLAVQFTMKPGRQV